MMQDLYKWQHSLASDTVEWMFATFGQAVKAATLLPIATSSSWDPICHTGEKELMLQKYISHGW